MPARGESKRPYYEGLNGPSPPLWLRFPELSPDRFEAFSYTARAGAGVRAPGKHPPQMRRDWYAVTALRIDLVRDRENQT
jgi:hypothetical protein